MNFIVTALLFTMQSMSAGAQQVTVPVTHDMLQKNDKILLDHLDGWLYKAGADSTGLHTGQGEQWIKMKPANRSVDWADEHGKLEGWFRIQLKVDRQLSRLPLGINFGDWAAVDVYLDGNLVGSVGRTGSPFQEANPHVKNSIPLPLRAETDHLLGLHFVDHISYFPLQRLRRNNFKENEFVYLTGSRYETWVSNINRYVPFFEVAWATVNGLIFLLICFLATINRREGNLPLIALNIGVFFLSSLLNIPRFHPALTFRQNEIIEFMTLLIYPVNIGFGVVLIARIFQYKLTTRSYAVLIAVLAGAIINILLKSDVLQTAVAVVTVTLGITILVRSWQALRGAQWSIVIGLFISTMAFVSYGSLLLIYGIVPFVLEIFLVTVVFTATPISLAVYVSLRFSEILNEVRRNAEQVKRISKEKEDILLDQKHVLEHQVRERTSELLTSIQELKATQSQLIQSEKMASLGELTAGIAHEIQNPLNFVNNFSEVNKELLAEMDEAIQKGEYQEARALARDLSDNQEKINHHGKRAEGIVKGMLQHSRGSNGQKEPTNLNALCDEYLRLSYHGFRAKDKSFSASIETDFDETLPKINVAPQDIGRVVLNLINNAFYAVKERSTTQSSGYTPQVVISTKNLGHKIEIAVKDNGNGIPDRVKDKIFQPFFTTKPTGQGTGLGLSLSYDIVKAHGGEIRVETLKSEGTEFQILIPLT